MHASPAPPEPDGGHAAPAPRRRWTPGPPAFAGLAVIVGLSWWAAATLPGSGDDPRAPAEPEPGAADAGHAPTSPTPSVGGEAHHVTPPPGDTGVIVPGVFRVRSVHASGAGWAILDGSSAHVALLDPAGRPGASFGRAGQGPGELSGPSHVARRGAYVAVLDLAATRLDRFLLDGTPLPRVSLPRGACPGTLAEALAASDAGWLVLQRCAEGGGATVRKLLVDDRGLVTSLPVDTVAVQLDDPFLNAVILESDGALYTGTTRSPCLARIVGEGPSERCLRPVPARPVPATLRQALEERLIGRARSVGLDLQVPEHLPAFLAVRDLGDDLLAVKRPLDERDAPWVMESASTRPLTLTAPESVRLEPGPVGVLLLRDDLAGLRSWVVPLPEPGR